MNAVEHFAALLPGAALRRLAHRKQGRFTDRPYSGDALLQLPRELDIAQASERVLSRWGEDLCGLLNALTHGELAALARALGSRFDGRSPELRAALWDRGASLERGGADIAGALQPRPVVLGGHLVVQAPPRGLYAPGTSWPRPLPPAAPAAPPDGEPETLDDLLAAADRTIGVRLGPRGRDKGAWGNRAAELLGVRERGDGEPDWRGDVEVKTVAIARDGEVARDRSMTRGAREPNALWRVREDPAIAMEREGRPLAKLVRTLWLARSDVPDGDATIVSWYLLEQDAHVSRLVRRYLHARPKGPRGTEQRGLYLHKRFFADAGMLATLNGPA